MIALKNEKEIKKIKEASHIVFLAHEAIKKAIRPGITTRELDKIGEDVIRANGANPSCKGYPQGSKNPFPATCCISVNDEIIHGIPSDRKLQEGDLVSIDIVADKDGYFGDAARSYVVGGNNPEAERLIKVTEECFWEGIKNAVIGNRISDISHAVQMHAEKNGYSVVREYQGHGVGFEMHEDPGVPNFGKPGRGPRLQEGMVIAVEPMINEGERYILEGDDGWTVYTEDGSLAAHYENTIVITKDGPKVLTMD
ncbi:MAG: type I methionyl aminopeptidase [Clostridia bacterium]|nr:type I methionyl aminopeptidase [Clostridia bacterium]